jgi:hypothetical protein
MTEPITATTAQLAALCAEVAMPHQTERSDLAATLAFAHMCCGLGSSSMNTSSTRPAASANCACAFQGALLFGIIARTWRSTLRELHMRCHPFHRPHPPPPSLYPLITPPPPPSPPLPPALRTGTHARRGGEVGQCYICSND